MRAENVLGLGSAGLIHPTPVAQLRLAHLLLAVAGEVNRSAAQDGGFKPEGLIHRRHTGGIRKLCELSPPLLALYFHHPREDPSLVEAITRYVRNGGALLAIHGVSASFKSSEEFAALLGGRFTGHAPPGEVTLTRTGGPEQPLSPEDPELPEQLCLRDEAYQHELTEEVDVWYEFAGGGPAVWTKGYGRGWVAYLAPGHTGRAWRTPELVPVLYTLVRILLTRGIR